jgi:hypothetical protein
VAHRLEAIALRCVADRERRERLVAILERRVGIVGALDVGAQEAGEVGASATSISTVVPVFFASFICDATVRFQMRS